MAAPLSQVVSERVSSAARSTWDWFWGLTASYWGTSAGTSPAASSQPSGNSSTPTRLCAPQARRVSAGRPMASVSSHPLLAELATRRDGVRTLLEAAMTFDEQKESDRAIQTYDKVVVDADSLIAAASGARDRLPGPTNEAALAKLRKQATSYKSIAIERKGALSGKATASVSLATAANSASLSKRQASVKSVKSSSSHSPQLSRAPSAQQHHSKALQSMDPKLVATIESEIVDQLAKVSFSDITGLEGPKQALNEMVILPARRPELFTGLRTPEKGLLLFGPPGNGKTMLAKAVACEADAVFFNISAASLTSKFVGESEKLVRTLFALAREKHRAVIFIDEIDSILGARNSNEHEASRRLKTEFLVAFDGVGVSAADKIVVMAATNRPWDLDEAALRRFPKRIYVPLPERAPRAEMVRKLLSKQKNDLRPVDVDWIAAQTEGYSFSDLNALAKDAAFGPLRDLGSRVADIPADKIRPVRVDDFKRSLGKIRPSVNPGSLAEFVRWRDEKGSSE
eukprot:Opistho-1_new@105110